MSGLKSFILVCCYSTSLGTCEKFVRVTFWSVVAPKAAVSPKSTLVSYNSQPCDFRAILLVIFFSSQHFSRLIAWGKNLWFLSFRSLLRLTNFVHILSLQSLIYFLNLDEFPSIMKVSIQRTQPQHTCHVLILSDPCKTLVIIPCLIMPSPLLYLNLMTTSPP